MSKILGSWSGMRKYLEEEMLTPSLIGRIRYGCTTYVGMDGCKIFEICIDQRQVKRFSLETVNTYFIDCGYKQNNDPFGRREYWDEFWYLLDKYPMPCRTEYTDTEFCKALEAYRNSDVLESVVSDDPIVRMFAVLDRRIGKRTLKKMKASIDDQPTWLKTFYNLRFEAENI